ncbi:ABC transporter permease [Georgenia deserti]|uniref:ABC transporter permease n=1 Tax=Georgenia deserti TaxID=2093781 RepID=A0ABW4L843_9MICO
MTATPTTSPNAGTAAVRAGRTRRLLALARAEAILLLRNKTALFNAVLLAPLLVGFFVTVGGDFLGPDPAAMVASTLTMLLSIALLMVVYYNLTTSVVARREELVLKRLRTGESTAPEILLAYALPGFAITLAQLVLAGVAGALLAEAPPLARPHWLILAVLGGTAVFALLAVASSGLTRTAETAQLTTMPLIFVALLLSGFSLPLHLMPDVVGQVAAWTPLYPVVTLAQHGFGTVLPDGTVASGALRDVAQPIACLIVWGALGVAGVRRWMRWEPRR